MLHALEEAANQGDGNVLKKSFAPEESELQEGIGFIQGKGR